MDSKDWFTALGLLVSVVTLLVKFSENNRETRAYTVATRSFALAKSIDEIAKDAPEGTMDEASHLRKDLLSSGKEATQRYLKLAQGERTIQVVDAAMYALVSFFLGLSLMSIHRVVDVGPAWEVVLGIVGVAFAALEIGRAHV